MERVSRAPECLTGGGAVRALDAPEDPQMEGGARAWTGAGAEGPREGKASSEEVWGVAEAFLVLLLDEDEGPLDEEEEPLTLDRGVSSVRLGKGSGAPSKACRWKV